MNYLILILSFIVTGCIATEKTTPDYENLIVGDFVISEERVEAIMQAGPLSRVELTAIVDTYSNPENEMERIISDASEISKERWMCGGVIPIIEDDSQKLYDQGSKFRVVGVSEKWIPINGKTTKVLRLKLAP